MQRRHIRSRSTNQSIGVGAWRSNGACSNVVYAINIRNAPCQWGTSLVRYRCEACPANLSYYLLSTNVMLSELARSYVQILNATHSDVSTTTEAVTLVGDFTRTIELMHAMGNPRLSFNSLQPEPALSAPVEGRTRLIRLLELFAHIQSFAPNHFGPESLSHWLLDSPYRRLETKLDEYTLQQPEVFSLSQESLQKSIGSGSIDQIHCTLMWHICVLVLNRGFLSIRGKSDGVASNPILIPYPAAPVHFLKEEERL